MWGALSEVRTGLPFTVAAGPRQRNHSWVWVPRHSWPYFTVSDLRLPQPGGPGPRIYILQEHGGPVIPPGIGVPFRRLLRLAGLWRRHSNPPPRGVNPLQTETFLHKHSVRTSQETHCVSATKPNRSMLLKETVAVCCENRMKHSDTLCGQNAKF
jgi:hypothetical protein